VDLALESGATVIGVNNRDLRYITVDLGAFERLAPDWPARPSSASAASRPPKTPEGYEAPVLTRSW
jgi:indole-3-glycerol phosphate synthase